MLMDSLRRGHDVSSHDSVYLLAQKIGDLPGARSGLALAIEGCIGETSEVKFYRKFSICIPLISTPGAWTSRL